MICSRTNVDMYMYSSYQKYPSVNVRYTIVVVVVVVVVVVCLFAVIVIAKSYTQLKILTKIIHVN